MEAAWIETKKEIARDSGDEFVINISLDEVEVNLEGVEEAEADEMVTLT